MLFNRITTSKEYAHTFDKGIRSLTPGFVCYYHPNNFSKHRFGWIASKKIGNAVKRNRAKRRLKAVSREIVQNLSQHTPPIDCVLIARKYALSRDYSMLKNDLQHIIKKVIPCAPC